MLGAYALAISYRGSLAGLLIYAYGPVTQFFPAVVVTLYARRISGSAVFGGLCAGIVVNTLLVIAPEFRPFAIHPGAFGLAANVVTLLVLSRLTRAGNDDVFLRVASTPSE